MSKTIKLKESQLVEIIHKVIKEQSEEREFTMAVQKFLNDKRILDAKLIVDGRTGPNSKTEAAIMKFQEMAKIYPADGVWGPETESQLKEKRPEWYKIWKSYKPGLFW